MTLINRLKMFLIVCASFALPLTAAAAPLADENPDFDNGPIFPINEKEHPSNHASSIAQMPNGDLLVSWFGGTKEGMPDVAIWTSRRPAGSKAWSPPEKLIDEPGLAAGNSIVFADSSGTVYLFYLIKYGERWDAWEECKIFARTSDDNGFTWSEPRALTDEYGWVIRNNPVELPDGKIMLPVYKDVPQVSLIWISDDGFKTWDEYEVPVTKPGNFQPAVAPLGGERFILLARHYTVPGKIWISLSKDGGHNWRKPKKLKFDNPDSGISLIALESGALVLAFNASKLSRTPLRVALSQDGGHTWPYIKDLETAHAEFSYPYLIQTGDGRIHVTYTADDRKIIKHADFTEAWLKDE